MNTCNCEPWVLKQSTAEKGIESSQFSTPAPDGRVRSVS
jgi:hypothetical protein